LVNGAHAYDLAGGRGDFRPHPASAKFLNGLAGTQELAGQVDGENPIPLLEGHLSRGGIALQPCVGDEYVDGAEFSSDTLEHPFDLRFV